jgi:hypothetical protein
MDDVQTLTGRLLMVQESRFRIATIKGQVYLFTLAGSSSKNETDLLDFFESKIPVVIEYQGEPGFDTGIAQSLTPLRNRNS